MKILEKFSIEDDNEEIYLKPYDYHFGAREGEQEEPKLIMVPPPGFDENEMN